MKPLLFTYHREFSKPLFHCVMEFNGNLIIEPDAEGIYLLVNQFYSGIINVPTSLTIFHQINKAFCLLCKILQICLLGEVIVLHLMFSLIPSLGNWSGSESNIISHRAPLLKSDLNAEVTWKSMTVSACNQWRSRRENQWRSGECDAWTKDDSTCTLLTVTVT